MTAMTETDGSRASAASADRIEGALSHRVLLVDKPAGCTSHDVVARVRRWLGTRRVGHSGTLDPFATGLLLVMLGRGTKLFPFLADHDKEYVGVVRLGVETTSGDPHGEVTATHPVGDLTPSDLEAAVAGLRGTLDQVPPMTSAVKHNGQPLYRLHRKGIEVERPSRRVVVRRFDLERVSPAELTVRIRCSKGTYVRTLVTDFGRALGVGAHLHALRRTAIGGLDVSSAATVDELVAAPPADGVRRFGLSLADALGHLPALRLTPVGVRKVRCGSYPTPVDLLDFDELPEAGQLARLVDAAGELVAIGRLGCEGDAATAGSRLELVRVI